MGTRGRKSAADLAVIGNTEVSPRANPPAQLSREEASVWVRVVNSYPADHFNEGQLDMLADFCRHCIRSNRIADLIHKAERSEDFDLNEYKKLCEMQDKQSRVKAHVARGLDIAERSVYKAKGGAKPASNPWEFEG